MRGVGLGLGGCKGAVAYKCGYVRLERVSVLSQRRVNLVAYEELGRVAAYIVVSALRAKLFFETPGYRFMTRFILNPGFPVVFASKDNDMLLVVGCCVCQWPVMIYL